MTSSSDPDRLVEAGSADFQRWHAPRLDTLSVPKPGAMAQGGPESSEDELTAVEDVEQAPRLPTAEELEQIREQAREEGYREGHEQGHAEGLEAGRAEQEALLDRMREILRYLDHPLQALDSEVETQLTQLAFQIARAVVQRELSYSREQLLGVVRKALKQLPAQDRQITIVVHPEDEAILRLAAREEDWTLEEDPSVAPGGCRIESGASRIDATLERRWATVAMQMLGEVPEGLDQPVAETLEPEPEDAPEPPPEDNNAAGASDSRTDHVSADPDVDQSINQASPTDPEGAVEAQAEDGPGAVKASSSSVGQTETKRAGS